MCHMYMTDFVYGVPIFLVPLSLSYPSSPVARIWKLDAQIVNCKILVGHPIFQGRPQYTLIATINMYLIIEIRHNILKYNVMGII